MRIYLVLTVLLLFPVVVSAGGFANLDLGAARCGMMSVVASLDDPSAVFHNPALLADQEENSALISNFGAVVSVWVRMRNEDGSLSAKVRPEKYWGIAPYAAVVSKLGTRFTFGLAAYFPNFYGAALPADAVTRYHIVEGYFVTGYVTPAVSYRISDWLALGASASYIYDRLEGKRKFTLDPEQNPEYDWTIDMQGEDHAFGWSLAAYLTPADWLRFGIHWQFQTDLALQGPITATQADGTTIFDGNADIDMVIPQQVRVGINLQPNDRWEIGSDISWFDYSVYRKQTIKTDIGLDFSSIKNYKSSWNVCLGTKYKYNQRWNFMAGIQHDWSPIPEEYFFLDNPAPNLYGISMGAFYQLGSRTRVGLSYVHNEYYAIEIDESKTVPPCNGIGEAQNNEVNIEFYWHF